MTAEHGGKKEKIAVQLQVTNTYCLPIREAVSIEDKVAGMLSYTGSCARYPYLRSEKILTSSFRVKNFQTENFVE